jgi:ubiquinone biosynthesis monooxygenase Coq7
MIMKIYSDPRCLNKFDSLTVHLDSVLQSLIPGAAHNTRTSPAENIVDEPLNNKEIRHAASLMRVNHTGEVCAQALYKGQALTAKSDNTRISMQHCADEEIDHLVWCEQRLKQLGSHTSILNPAFYGLSYAIGASAGKISDKISLGFVVETEKQVCKHLSEHLKTLPTSDKKSRAIISTMLKDEEEHANCAQQAGGSKLPWPIKKVMSIISKVMTYSVYRI